MKRTISLFFFSIAQQAQAEKPQLSVVVKAFIA